MRSPFKRKRIIKVRSRTIRAWLAILSVLVISVGGFASYYTYIQLSDSKSTAFELKAEVAVNAFVDKLNNYTNLLYVGRGLLQNNTSLTSKDWDVFFREQNVYSKFKGVSSISYVKVVDNDGAQQLAAAIRAQTGNASLVITPSGNRPLYALSTLISSDNNKELQKYYLTDVIADPTRKAVYDRADQTQRPTASPILTLKTGHTGFFITLPNYIHSALDGYIVVSFHMSDMMSAIMPLNNGLVYRVYDVTDGKETSVYESKNWSTFGRSHTATLTTIGSRTWRIEAADEKADDKLALYGLPVAMAAVTLAIVSALLLAENFLATKRERTLTVE